MAAKKTLLTNQIKEKFKKKGKAKKSSKLKTSKCYVKSYRGQGR